MAQVSDVQREAVVLAYFGGRTYREVAKELEIPEGTAKKAPRWTLEAPRGIAHQDGNVMEMSHDEIRSLIAPYVLGAVSPEETEYVRAHIATCDECRAEADSYTTVVSSLAHSVRSEPLPRDSSMGSWRAREEFKVSTADHDQAVVSPLVRPRRRVGVLAAAAAILLVAVLAGALIATTLRLADVRSDLNREREQLIALVEEQGGIRLDDPAGESVAAMLPTQEGGIFLAYGLEDAPEERTYQVWLIEGGEPTSAGTFDPSDGRGTLETDISLEGVEVVAVTIEPEGGSPAPTSDPVLSS